MVDTRFYKNKGPFSLEKIVDVLSADVLGDFRGDVTGIASLENATKGSEICFFGGKRFAEALHTTKSRLIVVEKTHVDLVPTSFMRFVVPHLDRAYIKLAHLFYSGFDGESFYNQKEAIDPSVKLGKKCIIGPGAIILKDAEIGPHAVIGPNVVIGHGVKIGAHSRIFAGALITHAILGSYVTIQQGVMIGQSGFGFVMDQAGHADIPQLGRVIIGDHVSIGSGTSIARGRLSDTVIGDGCRIDALVQLAHGVTLGKGCVIVAQVGIAGSTHVGDYTAMGGQAGLTEHLTIGKGVRIAAQSGVMRDIPDGGAVGGSPAVSIRDWQKQSIILAKLIQKK